MKTQSRIRLSPSRHVRSVAAALIAAAGAMVYSPPTRPGLSAQEAPLPAFEAASVKQNKDAPPGQFVRRQPGGRFTTTNMPLRELIRFAYQVQNFQLEGGPAWLTTDRWDIVAKAEGDPLPSPPGGPPDPMMLMLRTLMVDRFKLVVHRETKELPVYALVLARKDGKLGPKLTPSTVDCAAMAAARGRSNAPPPPAPPQPGERPVCGFRIGFGQMAAGGFPLSQLATGLSGLVQRVVLDRTGLTGSYDLEMTFAPDPSQFPGGALPPGVELPPIDPNSPSIFTALQEQLGLKLDAQRGPVEVLVIDRVERPTAD
jgi:uncharacterized protein (TIGR03435 family)